MESIIKIDLLLPSPLLLTVIANENMAANETNIFQPLYKQDEHANVLRQEIIEWAREQTKRLEQVNVEHLLLGLQVSCRFHRFRIQIDQILFHSKNSKNWNNRECISSV